jgi:DnaJ-class molecular chaperone
MTKDSETNSTNGDHNTDAVPPGTPYSAENVCRHCAGSGKIDGEPCPECDGSGKVTTPVGGAG